MNTHNRRGAAQPPTELSFDPFTVDPAASALMDRRVLPAPLVVVWDYRVARPAAFRDWLSTREIVLSEARLADDPTVADVRYLGTWRQLGTGAGWQTLWGYRTRAAMEELYRVCARPRPPLTIIQNDLADFVEGISRFLLEAGPQYFTQRVMVAAVINRE